mgnify:CR=1 FL=1
MRRKALLAVAAVALLTLSSVAGAAAGFGLNTTADSYPAMQFSEDQLDVAVHDRASMDLLEYQNDSGEVQNLQAHINGTEAGELVSYRADQLEEPEFGEYPRKDAEDGNNSASALDAAEWTTAGGTSVTQNDGGTAGGVQSVKISTNGSMSSNDVASATYGNQSITTDPLKRELQLVLNVDSLDSAAEVEIQVWDGSGDYVAAEINSSRDTTATDVVANATGNGIIYQEQLGDLSVQGASGDGSLDKIEDVTVEVTDADATVTLVGVNVEKKSRWDFGNTRVADGDGGYNDQTVYENADGGRINVTSLSSMGGFASDSVIHNLRYHDLEYRLQDKPSAVSVEWTDAEEYPGFPAQVRVEWVREIPTGYDLTHGNVELEVTQSFLSERYQRLRYAEAIGDSDTADVSDSSWVDLQDSTGEKGKEIVADASVQPGSTYAVQLHANALEEQRNALEATGGAGGFWGGSGGGNPLTSLYNWIAGGFVGLLSAIGIAKKAGG